MSTATAGADEPRDPDGIAAYEPYRQIIKRILAARRVASADAEDPRQEILVEVISTAAARSVASMPGLVARVSGCRIADYFRRRTVRRGAGYDDERDGEALPESQRPFLTQERLIEERERAEALDRLLEKMGPELGEVFRLIEVEG